MKERRRKPTSKEVPNMLSLTNDMVYYAVVQRRGIGAGESRWIEH